MSIFLKIDNFSGPTKFFCSRGNELNFGENLYGIATTEDITTKIFSVLNINDRPILQAHCNGIVINNSTQKRDDLVTLRPDDKITFQGYTCHISVIPSHIEAIAHIDLSALERFDYFTNYLSYPSVSLNIGALSSTYYLPPNKKISVGSNKENPIWVNSNLIKEFELSLTNINNQEIKIENFKTENSIITSDTAIELTPTLFTLNVSFPISA